MRSRHFHLAPRILPVPASSSDDGPNARGSLPPVHLRGYEPGDEAAILDTFNLVFSESDTAFKPRTMEAWRWLNLENPSGQRIRIAEAEDGRIAAHVAGIAQRLVYNGQAAFINQSVDGFSHPDWRRALKRPGIYAETLNSFNHTYAGPPPDGDIFVWGLPILNAWRIGQAFCEEQIIRTQNKLALDPSRLARPAAAGIEVEEVDEFPQDIDRLFERVAPAHALIAVRDKAQLDWRFVANPLNDYSIGIARTQSRGRGAGRMVGYAVYRSGAYDGESDGLLCDWLVDPETPLAANALRVWLAERARAEGLRVVAVFPDTANDWVEFQRAGFRVHPTSYFPTAYIYGKRLTPAQLHRDWYYTLGDSDLC